MPRGRPSTAGLVARAKALGIAAEPINGGRWPDGIWRVNGVEMPRTTLHQNLLRAERGQTAFQAFMPTDAGMATQLARLWAAAKAMGATVTLHPDGTANMNANQPQPLAAALAFVERNVRNERDATKGSGDWSLAVRAQAALGRRPRRIGSWWYLEGGGSYTTERLEQLVREREEANAAAA